MSSVIAGILCLISGKAFLIISSTITSGTSEVTLIEQFATDCNFVLLITDFISLLLIILIFPPMSCSSVVLMPILTILPRHPSMTTMSPTTYSPSSTINMPAKISAMRLCAPRPITDDIVYKGINTVSDITTEMLFTARCYEEDLYQVQRDLHRELKLLLDKNGIAPFAPPTYIIDGKGSQRPVPVSQIAHTQQHTMPQPAPQQHAPTAVQAEVKPQQEVQAKPVPTAEKDQPAPQDAQRPVVKPPENPEQARPIVKPPENAGQVRPVVKPPENAGQARPVVRPPENAGQAPQAPRPVVRPPQAGAPAPQGAPRPVLRGQPQTRNGQPGNGARPQQ